MTPAKDRIREYRAEFPFASNIETITALDLPPSTYYRAIKQIRQEDEGFRLRKGNDYILPRGVIQKIMPPESYHYVHLAAYLANFKMGDRVALYGKTKAEIMFEIKKKIADSYELSAKMIFDLYDSLALVALNRGDLSMFIDVSGNVTPPAFYLEKEEK